MNEKEYNPGFAFYKSFYEAIEYLPLEQQKEVCYAIVKYGITGEMVDPKEMPNGYSMTIANKRSIDDSVIRWLNNIDKANYSMDQKVAKNVRIAQLMAEDKNSREISEILKEAGYKGVSSASVRKSEPWTDRNTDHMAEEEFNKKWGIVQND